MLAHQNKIYRYRSKSFLKHVGLSDLKQVRQRDVDRFRANSKLSPHTVEAYIKAVAALTGKKFGGKKLRLPQKRPALIPLPDLGKVYAQAKRSRDVWLQWFLKCAYLTGLRHRDICEGMTFEPGLIQCTASKTGKLHLVPRHQIISGKPPKMYRNPKSVYYSLRKACERAGVEYFTPQQIRKTGANEYEKAHPGAGGVLLGHSLGNVTYRYYLDSVEVLKVAQSKLMIPQEMLPKGQRWRQQSQERELVESFRRLPEGERQTVLRLLGRAS